MLREPADLCRLCAVRLLPRAAALLASLEQSSWSELCAEGARRLRAADYRAVQDLRSFFGPRGEFIELTIGLDERVSAHGQRLAYDLFAALDSLSRQGRDRR